MKSRRPGQSFRKSCKLLILARIYRFSATLCTGLSPENVNKRKAIALRIDGI
jgi:hypothetical protein